MSAHAPLAHERVQGPPSLRVGELVGEVAEVLRGAGCEDPRREARDLVAAIFDAPRFWPSLEPSAPADATRVSAARAAAQRRAEGAPFAYAAGRASFRYLTLRVDARVLIPRQETELLVELVLAHARATGARSALDIGTGSGAIALALATEGPFSRVVATDISRDALQLAKENARAQCAAAEVEFREGDAFAPVAGERFDVIVSNPPYIAFGEVESLPRSVRDWEPAVALSCPADGLGLTGRLLAGASAHLNPGGLLALEVDERRGEQVLALAREAAHLVDARLHQDLAGRDRFVTARLQPAQGAE